MVESVLTLPSHSLFSNSSSIPNLSRFHLPSSHHHHKQNSSAVISGGFSLRLRCEAVGSAAPEAEITKKQRRQRSAFEIESLTTWLLKQEMEGNLDAELTIVLSSVSLACKQIASLLQRSTIANLTGAQGTINVQCEDQKKLDVISNEVFCNCLRSSGRTGIIASEEEDIPVAVEETYSGNYIVVFDPIDGSANIDTSLTTGSIFGIYGPDGQCLVDVGDDSTYRKWNPNNGIFHLVDALIGFGRGFASWAFIEELSVGAFISQNGINAERKHNCINGATI
ncbi:Fructose-1,6-bisphosphatase 1, chloroplastic [Sarracenia purpurea var. burkii]